MKTHRRVLPVKKKPTTARFVLLGGLLFLLFSSTAFAGTWTLAAAKARLRTEGRFEEIADAAAAQATATGRSALPWSNPFVGYQREQSFGSTATGGALSGTSEDYLWIGQTFDFSFRRGLLEDAGGQRATAAKLRTEERRRNVLLRFEQLFFQAIASAEREKSFSQWLRRLEELASKTRAREAQGDASRYDVLRIEREMILVAQRREELELHRTAQLAELAAWLEDDEKSIVLDGEVRPGPAPSTAAEAPRPLLAQALDEEAGALALEQAASGRWYLPPVTATAGGKTVFSQPTVGPAAVELGYLVTLQVPIPAFNRGGARRDELAAARRMAKAEAAMEIHHVHRRLAASRAVWARALIALDEHRSRASDRAQTLVKTARAAWAGGELSLLALLEAERTRLDDELVAINLSIAARNAQLSYAALTMEMPQ